MYKKIIFVTLSLSLILVMIPQMSTANSFSLRSSSKTVEPNKTFTLSVYVTPSTSASIYTAQANINFPADLVSAESFTYASAWFPMNQAGYDLIDNTNGKLIKTAGYPSGFNTETLLGTLVFKAKKAGSISITVNKESFILDMDSNNILKTYGSFSITSGSSYVPPVTPPKPPVTPPVTPPVKPTPVTPKPAPVTPKPSPEVEIPVTPEPAKGDEFNEDSYKENVITNVLFLFTGASVVDKIITNSFDIN